MTSNDNGVTTAIRFRDSAAAAQTALQDEYAKHSFDQDQRLIAGLHQAINYGLKFAEVSALIGIGEAIQDLVDVIDDPRPSSRVETLVDYGEVLS